MNSTIRYENIVRCLGAILCFVFGLSLVQADELKEARVTQVVKDVRLLPEQAAPRPATVNDPVRNGTAVRTGVQSRSELTFTDQTITRLGANTIFSFKEGTRTMDLGEGAILFQVPKGEGGATIHTAAVTAAITGTTGIGEFHHVTANNPHPVIKWLCLEGTIHLYLTNGSKESVVLHPGQMEVTDGTKLSKPVDFDIAQLVKTSLLIKGFDDLLPSLPLITIEIQRQLAGGLNGALLALNNPADIADEVDRGITAQDIINGSPSPTETPTPSITPSTPTPTPSKFGTLTTIASSDPYVITSGTAISTDPSITTNGHTDFGKIYRNSTQDGLLSAFLFGSTSAFDMASGFDSDFTGAAMGGAAFKFTSLRLTGDPMISTAGGSINLGLIAVNGITSGGPGGVLTFAGIRGLLLATQNGSIDLGPEISFSGLHDIVFYARGSGSMLTLASDVTTTNRIRLYGEGGIQLSSNLSTEDLIAFTNGDFDFTGGSIDAETISIISGGDLTFSLGTPLSFNTKTFLLQAEGNIQINDSLEVIEDSLSSGANLNISLVAASENINVEGDLSLTTNPGDVETGANIVMTSGGNTTIGGALTLLVDNSNGGHIGTGGSISVTTGGNLTADSLNALVNNRDGGSIGSGSDMTFDVGGALTTTGDASFVITNRNDGAGGGTVGGDAALSLSAASVSSGSFTAAISANAGGDISGDASASVNIAGALTTSGFVSVLVQGTGFNTPGGPFIAGGNIGGNAMINLRAASITTGDALDVEVDDYGAGHIGGDAIIDVAVSNNITVSSNVAVQGVGDAFFDIVNRADMSGSNLIDGGTIDGDAAVSLSAGNVTAQGLLEVGVLNNDQQFLNGGGAIGGDANIIFSAANVSSTNYFNLVINNAQGSIGGGSSIDANAANISTGNTFFAHILNENGQIGEGAVVSFLTPGTISAAQDVIFEIANPDGAIGEDATINVNAANITTGATLFASINNTSKGSIGGNAVINMNISGNVNVTTDATIQIFGSDGAKSAAININGGNYDVGGTFFNVIDGNGAIALNNASIHADVLKVGAFGTNGVLNIGGGTLSADTELKLYASGSNGQLNFISDVTLGGNSAKILAANSITIFNGVVVTIGGTNPADVFTNNANYSESSGGNDSTTGTFAGAGANSPQPLDNAPPFGTSASPHSVASHPPAAGHPPRITHSPNPSVVQARPPRSVASPRTGGNNRPARIVNVRDSDELISLIQRATQSDNGHGVPHDVTRTNDRRNSNRTNVAGTTNVGRNRADIQNGFSPSVNRLP